MYRTQTIKIVKRHDPLYSIIDEQAFKAKNLYNCALYVMRQAYFGMHEDFQDKKENV